MRTRYQHGNLQLEKRKNGPDVWVYRWREYGTNLSVRRRGELIGTTDEYRTKAEARKACGHLQLMANSDNFSSRDITFGTLLDRYAAEELPERHSTHLAYRSYIETHIRPKWAEWPLRRFCSQGTPFSIEQWLKTCDLAPKTKGNIRNVMSVIFKCAMRWGFIGVNPMALVRVKGVSRRQVEPRILNRDEIQALISALADPCRTAVILALSTGLRCSELFALKWLDFNWGQLTVLVRRGIVDGVVGEVKTKYSQSGLPLDRDLADVLSAWKAVSQFKAESDWVFASPQKAGELPLRSTSLLELKIKPAARAAKLEGRIGWHTFRHTYSSMLRQLGVDLKVQQELLRHADIRTTMNLYTQAVSEQKRAAHSKVVQMVLAS
ncbi:MAG TPA: site-specific integrase [Candidatus Sulfotelmatobacter sp.]|nr:site-specific integrase [Candidatus Sulfotelmatobacter sp.]